MTDLAGDWLASLPPAAVANFDAVKTSFDARYKTPEMVKYRSIRDTFCHTQSLCLVFDSYFNLIAFFGSVCIFVMSVEILCQIL